MKTNYTCVCPAPMMHLITAFKNEISATVCKMHPFNFEETFLTFSVAH